MRIRNQNLASMPIRPRRIIAVNGVLVILVMVSGCGCGVTTAWFYYCVLPLKIYWGFLFLGGWVFEQTIVSRRNFGDSITKSNQRSFRGGTTRLRHFPVDAETFRRISGAVHVVPWTAETRSTRTHRICMGAVKGKSKAEIPHNQTRRRRFRDVLSRFACGSSRIGELQPLRKNYDVLCGLGVYIITEVDLWFMMSFSLRAMSSNMKRISLFKLAGSIFMTIS